MALRTVKLDRAPETPAEMRSTQSRFECWRKSHRGRTPSPDALWRAAAELAQERGVFRTAKVLRLDYAKLKAMGAGGGSKQKAAPQRCIESLLRLPVLESVSSNWTTRAAECGFSGKKAVPRRSPN